MYKRARKCEQNENGERMEWVHYLLWVLLEWRLLMHRPGLKRIGACSCTHAKAQKGQPFSKNCMNYNSSICSSEAHAPAPA